MKEHASREHGERDRMLTKSSPGSFGSPPDHVQAEPHEDAEAQTNERGDFHDCRDEHLPDSAVRSSRYREGPDLLEGWGGPAISRDKMSSFTGQPSIKGRNESIRMMLLCAIHFGITFTWYGFTMAILDRLAYSELLRGAPATTALETCPLLADQTVLRWVMITSEERQWKLLGPLPHRPPGYIGCQRTILLTASPGESR